MQSAGWGLVVSFLAKLFTGEHQSSGTDDSHELFRPCGNDTDIIETLIGDHSGYNRHKVPGKPVKVRVEFWLQSITSLNELTQDFVIDLQINEYWADPALYYAHMNPCKQSLMFDKTILKKLWIPNTCFINSKQAKIHESPFINVFLMIYPNGSLWVNYRIKLTGPCDMDLKRFPWDQQICKLTFCSYNYNTDEVRMEWTSEREYNENFFLPDFTMTLMTLTSEEKQYGAGGWDELTAQFVFERRYGWYILQGYIPTYTTIFISWISFYLGARAIPARTMIGVNSLLAMTFQFSSIISNLPRVHYVKAMDVWMLGCVGFIFLSLLELALVGFMTRYPERLPSNGRMAKRSSAVDKHSTAWTVTADNRRDVLSSNRHRFGAAEGRGGVDASAAAAPATNVGGVVVVGVDGKTSSSPILSRMRMPAGGEREIALEAGGVSRSSSSRGHRRHGGGTSSSRRRGRSGGADGVCRWLCCCRPCLKAMVPQNPDHLDSFSAVFFPTAFFLFNVCYWGYYLVLTDKNRPQT